MHGGCDERKATGRFASRLAALGRSWFRLTRDEQKALMLVFALFLLGLAVRAWLTPAVP